MNPSLARGTNCSRCRGQILIEVLVALTLFLLVATVLVRQRLGWWQQTQQMLRHEGARTLAISKMEDLAAFRQVRAMNGSASFAGIRDDQGGWLPAGAQAGTPYHLHWQVTDDPAWEGWDIPAAKQVVVAVHWWEGDQWVRWQLAQRLLPLPTLRE